MVEYETLKEKSLALFFTCAVSLKTWHTVGSLEREVAIYNELSKYFKHIYFFTYGDKSDLDYCRYLSKNITVIPKKYISNSYVYSLVLPFIHRKILLKCSLIKTNQMIGAWSAAFTKMLYHGKLIIRTGYSWSINTSKETHSNWFLSLIKKIEAFVYGKADAAIVTSNEILEHITESYKPQHPILIPNYVDTELFRPLHLPKKDGSICFVGRISPEKNLGNLIEALKGLPYTLDIVGSGSEKLKLQNLAEKINVTVNFLGNIPNNELPDILNRHEIFILPSLWEGMPKVLLEAMACGLPVIGTNVAGIREVVTNRDNGILCETNADSLRESILYLEGNKLLKEKLGKNASHFIRQNYSLPVLLEKELSLYNGVFTKYSR